MNREIKFRVWSIEDKQWVNPNILEVWDDSGKLEPFEYVKSGTLNPLYTPKENYIIQQYTGVTDKNGVEIYEGDIIQYGIDLSKRIGVAGFIAGIFVCNWIDDQTENELGYMLTQDTLVIGNEFENPELLK